MSTVRLEIRPGVGGDEAEIFAHDLLRMYTRYADSQDWQAKKKNDLCLRIKGEGAFKKLKNEAGVHRVQRVPKTEKSGRIHTSTASVAVLKSRSQESTSPSGKPSFEMSDLKIETVRGSGPGGQHRNVRDTAVRITHLPTKTTIKVENERSQHQNKAKALALLQKKIVEKKRRQLKRKRDKKRRQQIGQAKRSEKIRTYNFPQNRVTDHRINKSWQNLDQVMDGSLAKIIKSISRVESGPPTPR